MDCWLKTGSLKKKENTKKDQLHDNKETDATTSTSHITDKLQKTAISNLNLLVLVIPVCQIPNMYYVTKL
jgi:hypothetical protein